MNFDPPERKAEGEPSTSWHVIDVKSGYHCMLALRRWTLLYVEVHMESDTFEEVPRQHHDAVYLHVHELTSTHCWCKTAGTKPQFHHFYLNPTVRNLLLFTCQDVPALPFLERVKGNTWN